MLGIGLLFILTNYCLHTGDAGSCYSTVVTAGNSLFMMVIAVAILYQQKQKSNLEHAQISGAPLHPPTCRQTALPTVMIAILGQQKESALPLYLQCIEALDYPKQQLSVYIQTYGDTKRGTHILQSWVQRVAADYARVEMAGSPVIEPKSNGEHPAMSGVLEAGLKKAVAWQCDYYFVVDTDIFIRPPTLSALVKLNLPIVAPFLKHVDPRNPYSNYHYDVDINGYYQDCEEYYWLHSQRIKGINEVKVVHGCYLLQRELIPKLSYDDGSGRSEYVMFSDSIRRHHIPQYFDNREIYGYLTLGEDPMLVRTWIGDEIDKAFYEHADS